MISCIVARASNGVIGSENELPWYLPADLKRFKELTIGTTVVMGRKTYDSIIARLGHALPNRRSVVLTRQDVTFPDADVIHDVKDIARLGNACIIGGAQVYQQTIDMVDTLYITDVHAAIDGDAYFPVLDPAEWREVSRESHKKDEKNQYDYDFVVYERIA
jgi:dihydrofolate reductase